MNAHAAKRVFSTCPRTPANLGKLTGALQVRPIHRRQHMDVASGALFSRKEAPEPHARGRQSHGHRQKIKADPTKLLKIRYSKYIICNGERCAVCLALFLMLTLLLGHHTAILASLGHLTAAAAVALF